MLDSSFTVPMRCSLDGRPFRVELSKRDGSKKWRIDRITPGMRVVATTSGAAASASLSPKLNSAEIDWSGWRCGVCGFGSSNEGQFVQCGTCNELVCGAKVRDLGGGIQTFECYPACGGGGRMSGQIESYSGADSRQTQTLLDGPAASGRLAGGHQGELPPANPPRK